MFIKFKIFLISSILIFEAFSINSIFAQDAAMDEQRKTCAQDSAMEWNPQLNRCISTQQAKQTRNEADACNKIEDLAQRSQCHKALAEKNSGVQSDPSKAEKLQGNSLISMAYAALGVITMFGKSGKESTCTSKKIFGVTSLAGSVADIMMKIQAKKKMKKLTEQFMLDKKSNAYQSQVKALEYLKEEQETVKDIAGKEKTRNMLMTAGFGAAALMAIYEMTPYGQASNPTCYNKEPKKPEEPAKPDVHTCESHPQECGPPAPAPQREATAADGDYYSDVNEVAEAPAAPAAPAAAPAETPAAPAAPAAATAEPVAAPAAPEKRAVVATEPQVKPNPPANPTQDLSHRSANGKEYISFKQDGKTYDVIDNKIYDRSGSRTPVGTLSYGSNGGTSTINMNNGKTFDVGNVVSSGSRGTIPISSGGTTMSRQNLDWRSGTQRRLGN